MAKGCTPDNAAGSLLARLVNDGFGTSENAIEGLTQSGKEMFNIDSGKLGDASLKLTNPKEHASYGKFIESTMTPVTEDSSTQVTGNIIQQSMASSKVLPENVSNVILKAVDEFALQHGTNLANKQKLYQATIRKAFKSIDQTSLNEGQKSFLSKWVKDLNDGYPFYNSEKDRVSETLSNFASQQISLSGNVIAGNPFEIMIKAPTIYGFGRTFQGITRALELTGGNLWGEIPELASRGVYGFTPATENASLMRKGLVAWQQLSDKYLSLTNNPLINIAYGIDGTRGVEQIAFVNRLGNASMIQRNGASAQAVRLLNYTIGTYHLLGSMIAGLRNPATAANSARGLATYFGILGALGGATSALEGKDPIEGAKASMIPEFLSWAMKKSDPSFAEWEAENLSSIGRLIRPGGISGIGIIANIVNRNGQQIARQYELGAASLQEGDIGQAAIHLGNASLFLAPFLTLGKGFGGKGTDEVLDFIAKGPLGNPRVRRTIQTAEEVFTGQLETDEGYQKIKETWLPFLREQQ